MLSGSPEERLPAAAAPAATTAVVVVVVVVVVAPAAATSTFEVYHLPLLQKALPARPCCEEVAESVRLLAPIRTEPQSTSGVDADHHRGALCASNFEVVYSLSWEPPC